MRWRWCWLLSRTTAMAVSAVTWLIVMSWAPAAMTGLLLAAIATVAGWKAGWMARCRLPARAARQDEAAAVLRALVPIGALRGRNQPSLWVSDRLVCDVGAVDERTFVVSGRLVGWLMHGQLPDSAVCEMVVRALALVPVHRSRLVATALLSCVPWTALTLLLRPARKLARILGPLVWMFAALAAGDLCQRGEWFLMVLLALVVVATVTTPRLDRAWAARCQAMAEDAVRVHLPRQASGPTRSGAYGTIAALPKPARDRDSR